MDADALMPSDIGPEEFEALTKAIGQRITELTGTPLEKAETLAVSVVCCQIVDDDGCLVFRDEDEGEVLRLPYEAFADLLDDGEEPPDRGTDAAPSR